ncbi:MAG: hypothetical protein KF886_24455 [Candidatus Hydrogenedentes bacterium]|nr:hypothetical protein [Candidatus Hydrogenedentota bacterium]
MHTEWRNGRLGTVLGTAAKRNSSAPKASTQTLASTKLSYDEYKQIGAKKNIRVIGVIRGRKTWTTEMGEKNLVGEPLPHHILIHSSILYFLLNIAIFCASL